VKPASTSKLDFNHLAELIDIRPRGGHFIHSTTEPFDEEGEMQMDVLQNWLRHFNLTLHHPHSSGHASSSALRSMVTGVKPKHLLPIHTEESTRFKDLLPKIDVEVVSPNQEIKL